MSTTAVIIEHLIGGIQAALWLALLVLLVFGCDWIPWGELKDVSTHVTFVALAVIYPLGIFVDDVADRVFHSWSQKIRYRRLRKEKVPDEVTAISVLQHTDNEFLREYFNYIRMRIRISRSSAVNFGLTTLVAIFFIIVRLSGSCLLVTMVLGIGFVLTLLAISAWRSFSDTFAKRIAQVWKKLLT